MLFVLKTSLVIFVLSSAAIYLLRYYIHSSDRQIGVVSTSATGLSFLCLCASHPFVALAGIGTVATVFTRRRTIAAGVALFIIITLPNVSLQVMAGSLQLISISPETCATIGLLLSSFGWKKAPQVIDKRHDLPAVMLILVLTFITARDSTITNMLRATTENLIAFLLPYALVRVALKDERAVRFAVLFVVAAGLAVSAVAIFESVRVWPIYQIYSDRYGILTNAGVKMRGGMLRAAGPMMNPPISGSILAMCFVTAVAARDLFMTRTGHRIVLAILITGLFMMQTRVAWLGAVCGSVGIMVSRQGAKAFTRYIPILAVILIGVYGVALTNERFANLVGFSADAKGSSEYRDALSDRGLELVKAHPLIGQPYGVVELQMADLRQGEGIIDFVNSYLAVALFSGLIGLSIFVGALLLQGYGMWSGKRRSGPQADSLNDLGFGIVVAIASMFPFISTDRRIVLTTILLFALGNAIHARGRPRAEAKRAVPPLHVQHA